MQSELGIEEDLDKVSKKRTFGLITLGILILAAGAFCVYAFATIPNTGQEKDLGRISGEYWDQSAKQKEISAPGEIKTEKENEAGKTSSFIG